MIHHNSGYKNGKAKLTEEQVQEIRKLRASIGQMRRVARSHPASLHSLAQKFGVTPCVISGIALRRDWKHVP